MSTTIRITDVVGTTICVAVSDGHKVYERIASGLERGEDIDLSFSGVTRLTTAFLNAAVGQAYNDFDNDVIRSRLHIKDVDEKGLSLLKKVVDRAKVFYSGKHTSTK